MIIRTAAPEEWADAIALSLQHLNPETRGTRALNVLTLIASGTINPEGIFVAKDAHGLRGAQVCVPLPGASCIFWLPRTEAADGDLATLLVQHGLAWLTGRSGKLAQAILSSADSPAAAPLLRCGFRHVTRLFFLENDLEQELPEESGLLHFYTYSPANQDQFHATLMRTYEGTLDCPELNGRRTLDDIIAGHMGHERFSPDRWWLARSAGRPVAVGLVAELADQPAWDLSYLGVVPEARRLGWGRQLAIHILRAARVARASKVILAVDARNEPALQLYRGLGFLSVDTREVYLHFLNRDLAGEPPRVGADSYS